MKEKKGFFGLLAAKWFGGKKSLDIWEEEQVQSPMRTIVRNFAGNKLGMAGLIVFLLMFLAAFIGPFFFPLDLSYTETTQSNVPPGKNMLKLPAKMKQNSRDITAGPIFGAGVSEDGSLHVWGKTRISGVLDLADIPQAFAGISFRNISAGNDHILALTEDGKVVGWGNDRMGQSSIPDEVERAGRIVQIAAGFQCSMALTEDGEVYVWGNTSLIDFKEKNDFQGRLKKVVLTADAVLGLTTDGEAVYLGRQQNSFSTVPSGMGTVTDIAAAAASMCAVNEDGELFVWGSSKGKEKVLPVLEGKVKSIQGGRYHYSALLDNGSVVCWGDNRFSQSDVPGSLADGVKALYTGSYQNYAVKESGEVVAWGLKGYLLGTDDFGRDILNRLVNGARMTMTIGAVAVVISTAIGVLIGGISGFFGGKVDMLLQRMTELVSSLPFLPFAMLLSSIIGNRLGEGQRITIIMIILGLLSWPALSRLVRAQVLSEREKEFVVAARSIGVKEPGIVFRHILPNVVSVIIVSATLDFASCMLIESTLSYLGFGVNPPQPTWGNMLYGSNNSIVIQSYWWRWVFPALALSICTICINLVGDGLRDAVDPRTNER